MPPPYVPVGGTPLLPPSYLTVYFGLFLLFWGALYIYFYHKKRPVLFWQEVRLLLVIAIILKVTVLVGGSLVAAYWLVPTPSIRRTVSQQPDKIEIVFDRPVNRNLLEKSISPETPGLWVFENSLYSTHLYRKLVFYPTFSLRSNTTYSIKLGSIQNLAKISQPYDYQFEFTSPASPVVVAVSESDGGGQIRVTLDKPNDRLSEFEFQFTPNFEYEVELDAAKTIYSLTPKTALVPGTEYKLKVQKTDVILNLEDETIVERSVSTLAYDGSFTTKPVPEGFLTGIIKPLLAKESAKIIGVSPQYGLTAVSIHTPIRITFDQAVDHPFTQAKFSLAPAVDGSFGWEENTLIFTPQKPLAHTTTYTITIEDFNSQFTTHNATTKLAVPVYLQKYTLSCEIAALRMALNFRGANVSEDDIIPVVGLDPTPHSGNTWGNPNAAFVGNIRGTQMKDGYGVHWGPIARAARTWRNAADFQGWRIDQLTDAISSGNPVVIWVYSHYGNKTSWNTPDGTSIYAVRDEHAVVAVGFVGPPSNPTQIIINDPLIGQVYWSRASFDKKWGIFSNSGVVVY